MTPKEIAEQAERMASVPDEHGLSDAFKLIAEIAKVLGKRGRPPKDNG